MTQNDDIHVWRSYDCSVLPFQRPAASTPPRHMTTISSYTRILHIYLRYIYAPNLTQARGTRPLLVGAGAFVHNLKLS